MLAITTDLMGLGSIPSSKPGCLAWLKRNGVRAIKQGNSFAFNVFDLPASELKAYLSYRAEALGVDFGTYDDEAHSEFLKAPASLRDRAERDAAIAVYLVQIGDDCSWPERTELVQEKFGTERTSQTTLKRLLKAVQGVDPINFAPALLPAYRGGAGRVDMSEDAWRFFMTTIRDASRDFPLKQAWRDVRDISPKMGWKWPSYPTVYRRWTELDEAQRLSARFGRADAVNALTQPALRDKTTISALEWVSLDGRMQDFWVDWGDGRAVRPVMLALIDVASNKVIGYELAPSENAAGTVRLIRKTCEQYGIFDRLYTDNGSSFAGHLVAGGNPHRFRNAGRKPDAVQPLGICKILGIKLHFALPKNAQAKIAERTFASLSRVIDDRPEFKGCHAGHNPGASPEANVVPLPIADALDVIEREIARHNHEAGRRSSGANGRSYEAVFRAGMKKRIHRKPTARQLYLAGLIYTPVAVDRNGQVKKNGWVYGGPETQNTLLKFHGTGQKILLGRDPDDFNAPAIAFDEQGNLICEGIAPIIAGPYGSVDGIRQAARNRKAARAAVAAGEAANDYLTDEEFKKALAALDTPHSDENRPAPQVVAGQFGSPLKQSKTPVTERSNSIPEEFLRNMDTKLAALRGGNGKPA